ncbi:3'-5' exonuclease [Alishewanella longhuensis]|uniref:DNA-directed DNA polymerase n=1 Tax=Alishewanella longhuensis TaxID=1091037 RepID=A0ABQ3L3A8_9ALTE|nr:3'-5' exonuclease [Alishewanella longhuensis]GHG77341.1 3'-5' exonuclease [Alishewanella longhuensis]
MLYLGSQLPKAAPVDWQQRFAKLAQQSKQPLLQQYYAAGMVDGRTAIANTPLLALDLETTGLDPRCHGIVSIGLVPLTSQRVQSSQAQQWLVKPRFALTSSSVKIHRITDSALANAPDLLDILPEFLAAIAGKVLLVHCADIERQFLAAALNVRLRETLQFPVIDTMALEGRLYRAKPLTLWQKLRKQQQPSIRLAASRSRYGLPPYLPHHAVTDALACAELFLAQLTHRFPITTAVNELWD